MILPANAIYENVTPKIFVISAVLYGACKYPYFVAQCD
jgi:hypothetical protein